MINVNRKKPMGTMPGAPGTSAPTVKPPAVTYKPPVVKSGPMLPPPRNEPMDLRRGNPTPNDRPAPSILPGEPNGPQKPIPPNPPVPRGEPLGPYNPNAPDKSNPYPNDPSRGRGTVPPPPVPQTQTPPVPMTRQQINNMRRNETPDERLARLKQIRTNGKGQRSTVPLNDRIKALKGNIKSGDLDPDVKYKKQRKEKGIPVQVDDDPSTWNSEARAELALPRGMSTMFYDNPEGDAQNKLAQRQKDKMKAGKKKTPTPTSQVPNDENEDMKPKDNAEKNDTRRNEDLADRLKRLQEKLKTAKPGQRAQLEARIAALKKRIKAGDTTGRNKNQPGSPQRPYRNREVTYKPLGYGGSLRI